MVFSCLIYLKMVKILQGRYILEKKIIFSSLETVKAK